MRFALLIVFLLLPCSVFADNFSVLNTNDSGAGSLRQAIIDANASGGVPHIITFAPAFPQFGLITLQSNLPIIVASDVRFRGSDRSPVVSGAGQYAILRANPNVSLDVEDMNFQSGLNDNGGCIATESVSGNGTLTVTRGYFYQCKANAAALPGGGAIYWNTDANGLLTINDSAFFENSADSTDTATEQPRGGAVASQVSTIIHRSIFVDNQANSAGSRGGYGGAVAIYQPENGFSEMTDSRFVTNGVSSAVTFLGLGGAVRVYMEPGGVFQLERNYFSGNSARIGGAVYLASQQLNTTTQTVVNNNTLVSNSSTLEGGALVLQHMQLFADHNSFWSNSSASGSDLSLESINVRRFVHNVLAPAAANSACAIVSSSIVSGYLAGNLFNEACGILSSTGGSISANLPVQEVDATQTVGVLVFADGADPIDGGTAEPSDCAATDARKTTRPRDGDDDGTAVCDVGAYEAIGDTFFADGFES